MTRTHIFCASRCSTLICDAWCRRHYDGTGRCRQSTLLWRRTRGTAMHAVPDDTSEAMATCMASVPNRRTSVTSGKICSRQPLQIPSRTSGTTTRVRTVIQTAARVSRQHFKNVHCTHACILSLCSIACKQVLGELRQKLKELQLAITCNPQASLAILRRHLTTSRKTSVMTMSLSRPRCSFMLTCNPPGQARPTEPLHWHLPRAAALAPAQRAQRSVWRHLARVSTATRARAGPARRQRTSNHG